MHTQGSQRTFGANAAPDGPRVGARSALDGTGPRGAATGLPGPGGPVGGRFGPAATAAGRVAPLRVDAQRNLEHVLRAAREVFGELGYGAPMEDVARRARVGVGTVYRRFPSKDVLVRRIAEEETARLTDQARTALGQEEDPWAALSRFLRTSVASGAGRLLPPQVLRVRVEPQPHDPALARVPQPREPGEVDGVGVPDLLAVVGQLVERARSAGELRQDVSVGDVLLVIATAAPALPDPAQHAAAAARLLDILLEGLRPHA
jgi:AcrR family transcriptional regulator